MNTKGVYSKQSRFPHGTRRGHKYGFPYPTRHKNPQVKYVSVPGTVLVVVVMVEWQDGQVMAIGSGLRKPHNGISVTTVTVDAPTGPPLWYPAALPPFIVS